MRIGFPRDWMPDVYQQHGEVGIDHVLVHVSLVPFIFCFFTWNITDTKLSLVVIEMFNAMNALSSSESLLTFSIWNNVVLIYAIVLSMVLHFILLYVPLFQKLFSVLPLNWNEWQAVLLISLPVM